MHHQLAGTVTTVQRTRTKLTTLFLRKTRRKKRKATVRRIGLKDRRRSTVERMDVYVWQVADCRRSFRYYIVVGPCFWLSIKNILPVCCLIVAMPSGKREAERTGNPSVNTGPSPNSDERTNNTMGEANEPALGSGSLQLFSQLLFHNSANDAF
ncbi:hypothetical protein T07_3942 [Trichinella nelsoni]|uniref:Uncharacterized protein n=1 Tax=Trichinella nelsoni TaxID=6336 RepID=A0A0V0RK49_9BILA|nr:hypothetical protein T07_3942 [Trichinella nelsoni]